MNIEKVAGQLVGLIASGEHKKATKYLAPNYVIKATRQGGFDKRDKQVTVITTLGRPNYAEKDFIKKAELVGEPFPIKKIQLK